MLDEAAILARGVITNVVGTLGDGDSREPANHWKNTNGKRIYEETRVETAEQLIRNSDGRFYRHVDADRLNAHFLPVTPAVAIVDYRKVLKRLDPDLERDISLMRLSHPVAGRHPGGEEKERTLIAAALLKIARYAYPTVAFDRFEAVEDLFCELAKDSTTRLDPPWPNVILRRAGLIAGVSQGCSRRSARRLLDMLALVSTDRIPVMVGHGTGSDQIHILALLQASPTLRFDHRIRRTTGHDSSSQGIEDRGDERWKS